MLPIYAGGKLRHIYVYRHKVFCFVDQMDFKL
jgi:hypothetical protein